MARRHGDREGRRVAITGFGVVSSIGIGAKSVQQSLRSGVSGIRLDESRRALGFRSALTGVIQEFRPHLSHLSRKEKKSMPDFVKWSVEAVLEAISMAHLPKELLQSNRTGLVFGNDSVARGSFEQVDRTMRSRSTAALHSGMVFRSMNSTITMNLNALLGTRGAAWTVSGACASGGHAVGQAAELIRGGRQDIILCGGAQEMGWEAVCSFDALCAFSTREDDPSRASRPFDAGRDGLVPSGGAAVLVLESYDSARDRGAPIFGEVVSYAFTSDGGHIAVPSGEGLMRCISDALEFAELKPNSIDYVSAHGTGTPVGDAAEAQAIVGVFGTPTPWVSSNKSQTGHEMWMSGASQVVYALLGAHGGFIPPNLNFEQPDETTRQIRVASEVVNETPELIVCNAAGFGGTNSCLVIRAGI